MSRSEVTRGQVAGALLPFDHERCGGSDERTHCAVEKSIFHLM